MRDVNTDEAGSLTEERSNEEEHTKEDENKGEGNVEELNKALVPLKTMTMEIQIRKKKINRRQQQRYSITSKRRRKLYTSNPAGFYSKKQNQEQ
jgi:hypothetical protein